MIDFRSQPIKSGKTNELVRLYTKNPGLYVHPSRTHGRVIRKDVKTCTYYDVLKLGSNFIRDFNWFYFDEFFMQDYISYEDIIQLDKNNKNIVIRGTPNGSDGMPTNMFISYIREHYPEYYI